MPGGWCSARPSFSAAVMLAIALGVGANTAVFSVARGVLWRPLPFDEPGHLLPAVPGESAGHDECRSRRSTTSIGRTLSSSLDASGGVAEAGPTSSRAEGKELIPGRPRHGIVLRCAAPPALPRTSDSSQDEDNPAGQARRGHQRRLVARALRRRTRMSSGGRWLPATPCTRSSACCRRPSPSRHTTRLSGRRCESGDRVPPHAAHGELPQRHRTREARASTLPQVQEDLDRLGRGLAAEYPATNAGVGIAAVSLHDFVTGQARTPLLLLVAAAAAVLLISCANVAHLLLARTDVARGGTDRCGRRSARQGRVCCAKTSRRACCWPSAAARSAHSPLSLWS